MTHGRRLLIAHLLQPHHGAPQEFAHRRRADSQGRPDFRVPQAFHAQKQAAPLLLAKALPPRDGTASSVRAPAARFSGSSAGDVRRASRSGSNGSSECLPGAHLQTHSCAPRGRSSRAGFRMSSPFFSDTYRRRKTSCTASCASGGCRPRVSRYRYTSSRVSSNNWATGPVTRHRSVLGGGSPRMFHQPNAATSLRAITKDPGTRLLQLHHCAEFFDIFRANLTPV